MRILVLLCGMMLLTLLTLGCRESGTSSTGPAPGTKVAIKTPAAPASAPAAPASAPASQAADDPTPADQEATAGLRATGESPILPTCSTTRAR